MREISYTTNTAESSVSFSYLQNKLSAIMLIFAHCEDMSLSGVETSGIYNLLDDLGRHIDALSEEQQRSTEEKEIIAAELCTTSEELDIYRACNKALQDIDAKHAASQAVKEGASDDA